MNQLNLLGFEVLLTKQKVHHKNVMVLKSFQVNFKMAVVTGLGQNRKNGIVGNINEGLRTLELNLLLM